MKIVEILSETHEHIRTFWSLHDVDIASYRQVYDSLAQLCINEPGNDFIRGDLVKLFSHLHALLRDTRWQHIADDPDYDLIYDGLSDIHDDIIK